MQCLKTKSNHMIYVYKVAGLVGVKPYVSTGLITSIVKLFAVITVSKG